MMFRRKIADEMLAWKNSTGKKRALVIKGLRQIGKTFSVRAFAAEQYQNVVYINFKNNRSVRAAFEGDLSVDRIVLDISAIMPGVHFVPNETVIILDEIQECANARASLKPFVEDGRYDVICTGSLLGVKGYNRKNNRGVPVGSEQIIYMHPMDFEEFLWAKGIDEQVITELRCCLAEERPIRKAIHEAMQRYYREYLCVGGMPYVVERFIESNDMGIVLQEQRNLLDEYRDDFAKHLDENENEVIDQTLLARINKVFDSIPAQLADDNKKFVYSKLGKSARAKDYEAAIQWLSDFGLANRCFNLRNISLPLEGNKNEDVFKVYLCDTGLFVAMLDDGIAGNILSGDLGMYKGALYENIIADCFSKTGKRLYYYKKEDSTLEIDFVTAIAGEAVIVEVKAVTGNAKSAKTVLKNKDRYGVNLCIKLGEYNIGRQGEILTVPSYLAFELFK